MIVSTISEKVDKSDVESISSETIKDESGLSLSRAYSVTSEPPAYKKQTASSVRIARLIAITVVAVALILGTAIVLAAYLQMRHNGVALHSAAPVSSTETNKAATASLPSALTGDAPTAGAGELSSSESSSEAVDEEKDHRRLDTDGDLLEEFLENEGKILRLPTGSDLDIDIDELTKMFLKRNPLDKSKCVVERRPLDGAEDYVKVLPITAKNATAVPLMPIISGERISIICSSDEDSITELNEEDDSGLIHSRPIFMPFDMHPPISINPFNMMGGMPMNSMSAIGPIPLMMNPNQMMPPRSMRPTLSLNLTPPFDLNNALLEQRLLNPLNVPPPPPPPQMRSPFQAFPAGRPFRFPEANLRQMRPFGPVSTPPPPQFQPFQQFQQRPFDGHAMAEKRFNLPSDLIPDNSQEKSHVPEHRGMNSDPIRPPLVTARPVPLFRERQRAPDFQGLPESLLSLVEDLPGILGAEEPQPVQRLSIRPEQPNLPVFRVPKFLLDTPRPKVAEGVSSTEMPSGPVQLPNRPVTLPFLQVPPLPAALVGKERSAPIPVNIPFLNVRNAAPPVPSQMAAPDRRQGRASFFERLMDSILSPVNNRHPPKNEKSPSGESVPADTRATQPVRTGGRGLRTMPENGPALDGGIIVARPVTPEDESIAPEQDRRARAHFIQPRSLKVN